MCMLVFCPVLITPLNLYMYGWDTLKHTPLIPLVGTASRANQSFADQIPKSAPAGISLAPPLTGILAPGKDIIRSILENWVEEVRQNFTLNYSFIKCFWFSTKIISLAIDVMSSVWTNINYPTHITYSMLHT